MYYLKSMNEALFSIHAVKSVEKSLVLTHLIIYEYLDLGILSTVRTLLTIHIRNSVAQTGEQTHTLMCSSHMFLYSVVHVFEK